MYFRTCEHLKCNKSYHNKKTLLSSTVLKNVEPFDHPIDGLQSIPRESNDKDHVGGTNNRSYRGIFCCEVY